MSSQDYRDKILQCLYETATGLTIIEISRLIDGNRNTVSKYLNQLENENLVFKKDIGKASLFFSKKRKSLPRNIVIPFMKAFLSGLNMKFPNKESTFKEIGRLILNQFQFSFGRSFRKQIEHYRGSPDLEEHLKRFKKLYITFDILQEDLDIEIIEMEKNKAIYRFKNSEFLGNSEEYIYYFHIICGVIEVFLSGEVPGNVICNIEAIHINDKRENSYIDISIEIEGSNN